MTKCPVLIDRRSIAAAEQIPPNWIAVKRDGHVFAELETCQLDRNQTDNLLWGAGIDLGPGAPLALPGDLGLSGGMIAAWFQGFAQRWEATGARQLPHHDV